MQTRSCFHEISETGVVLYLWSISLMCICFCWSPPPHCYLIHVDFCSPSLMCTSFPSTSSEPFLASPAPQTSRPRHARSCHNFSSDTIPQMPARWLVFSPSFIFFSALFLALPSVYSLHRSLRHWPLGSTEQNWFRVFHGSWMRQQLCNRGRDGEKKGLNK